MLKIGEQWHYRTFKGLEKIIYKVEGASRLYLKWQSRHLSIMKANNHIWMSHKTKHPHLKNSTKCAFVFVTVHDCQANTRGLVRVDTHLRTHKKNQLMEKQVKAAQYRFVQNINKGPVPLCSSARGRPLEPKRLPFTREQNRWKCRAYGRFCHLWLRRKDLHASHAIEMTEAGAEREPLPSCG